MPTYNYECSYCHYEFEQYLRHTGDDPGVCPDCGGALVQVIRHAPALKGPGLGHKRPYDMIEHGEPSKKIQVRVPKEFKSG